MGLRADNLMGLVEQVESLSWATKLLSLCRLMGSCTGPYLSNWHAAVMSKPGAGFQEQCYVLCGILLSHAGATELGPPALRGRADCRGSSPGFYIWLPGAPALLPALPKCGG